MSGYIIEKETKEERVKPKEIKKEKVKMKLSYKEQRELEILPDRIENLEERIDEVNGCLSNPDCYKDIGLNKLADELKELELEYEEATRGDI